jgi:short-subunit dehydrogenase
MATRVVVLTGASSGLGRATALALAADGDDLVLVARGRQALQKLAEDCRALGAEALVVKADIGDAAHVERIATAALEHFGRIDVWISTAAVLAAGPLSTQPAEDVEQLLRTNVTGAALVARQALLVFESQGHGTLVLVSSLLGVVPNPLVPTYVASKFAVRGLALSLRQAVAHLPDVHVSCVLPGPMDTPMFQRAANHTGRRMRAIPPALAPERVARAVLKASRTPRRQVTAGATPRLLLLAHRLSPRLTEWGTARWAAPMLTTRTTVGASEGALHHPLKGGGRIDGGWRRGRRRRRLGSAVGVGRT